MPLYNNVLMMLVKVIYFQYHCTFHFFISCCFYLFYIFLVFFPLTRLRSDSNFLIESSIFVKHHIQPV